MSQSGVHPHEATQSRHKYRCHCETDNLVRGHRRMHAVPGVPKQRCADVNHAHDTADALPEIQNTSGVSS